MRIYHNIKTTVRETEVVKGNQHRYNLDIETDGIKAFDLTDIEYARVLQALKILDSKRFSEVEK